MITAKLIYAKLITHIAVFAGAGGILVVSYPHVLAPTESLEASPVVARMVEYELTAGDRFALVGAWRDAIGAYETAASLSRAQRQLPTVALRRVANALYYDSQFLAAAGVLQGLADEAALLGDAETEFWATLDAAQLSRMAGAEAHARRLNERATRLLQSGRLDEREYLEARMEEINLKVFAPHLESR
jgi:hypothetical protein